MRAVRRAQGQEDVPGGRRRAGPKKLERACSRTQLVAGEGGRMQVVLASDRSWTRPREACSRASRRGQEAHHALAVTRFRVLRRGDRALLELSPETGRTHQLRVQVAAAGGAIAGDQLYGQQPAHRLMLHAARLELRHPTIGRAARSARTRAARARAVARRRRALRVGAGRSVLRVAPSRSDRRALGTRAIARHDRISRGARRGGRARRHRRRRLWRAPPRAFFFDEALAHKEAILDALRRSGRAACT